MPRASYKKNGKAACVFIRFCACVVCVCVCAGMCLFVWWTIIGMRRSQRGCTAVSQNQMAEQSVMRQTTETQPDPEDLKGRRRRGGRGGAEGMTKGRENY